MSNSTKTSSIENAKVISLLSNQLLEQDKLIHQLTKRVDELETAIQSIKFSQESIPVKKISKESKSKSSVSKIDESNRNDGNSSPIKFVEKNVAKNLFMKLLTTGCEFKYYKFQDNKNEHNWQTLIDDLEMDFSDVKKLGTNEYHMIIQKLIDDHQSNIDDGEGSLQIAYLKNNTAQYKNTILVLDIHQHTQVDNMDVPKSSGLNHTIQSGNENDSNIFNDIESFKNKVMFAKVEEFTIDGEDTLAEIDAEKVSINVLYKKVIGNYIGRVSPSDLFSTMANKLIEDGKNIKLVVSKVNKKTGNNELYTYQSQIDEVEVDDD